MFDGYVYDYDSVYTYGYVDDVPYFTMKEEVRSGDLNAVRLALESETLDPNTADDSYTILHWAAGHTETHILYEEGLSSENIAARRLIVHELLEQGANPNTNWVQQSYHSFHSKTSMDLTRDEITLQMLREASVKRALAVDTSVASVNKEHHLQIGLLSAAVLGRTEDCTTLCALGSKVDETTNGATALSVAASAGHLETVQKLVHDLRADVNNVSDKNGNTDLSMAVVSGREEIVRFLLDERANPLQKDCFRGGLSTRACSSLYHDDDPEHDPEQDFDSTSNVRARIIELILSASVATVKEQVSEMVKYEEHEWKDYSWVFMECVRHGYKVGMSLLLENAEFELPPTCLQLAAAVGDHDALTFLLEIGALASYEEKGEERWRGLGHRGPDQASVRRCERTLKYWLDYVMNTDMKGCSTLQQACCGVLYKHRIPFPARMELLPDDVRSQIFMACPPSSDD